MIKIVLTKKIKRKNMCYQKIIEKYNKIRNLNFASSLLNWDQATYMPKKGLKSRAEVVETITELYHSLIVDDAFYNEINNLVASNEFNQLTEFQKEEILEIKRIVEKERKIPVKLKAEISKNTSLALGAWEEAKITGDDREFLPLLKKNFSLKKELTDYIGYEENPYDVLLDDYDKGLKYSYIGPIFSSLKKELTKIISEIKKSKKEIDTSFIYKYYPKELQWEFGLKILKKILIDFESFRQDVSTHPFTTTIGINDVRITTNIDENNLIKGFFSTLHEGGHCLYELRAFKHLDKSPFSSITSLSLHESQSRLFENIIGRNLLFWQNYYSELQKYFKENLSQISVDKFYLAINNVKESPIRIEADEVTYNLHIILRTDIENLLINEKIKVDAINEVWNEYTKELFGFYPKSKKEGYLQDIHWAEALIGYFPTYTLGNLIAAQLFYFFEKSTGKVNTINDETLIKLVNWLDENIYIHGSRKSSFSLIKEITGNDIKSDYFIAYLKNKFLN